MAPNNKFVPSKIRPDSPSKVFAVPLPVINLLLALLLIVVPAAASQATPEPVDVNTCPSEPCPPFTLKFSPSTTAASIRGEITVLLNVALPANPPPIHPMVFPATDLTMFGLYHSTACVSSMVPASYMALPVRTLGSCLSNRAQVM